MSEANVIRTSLKISEILEQAADALDARGWIRGDYGAASSWSGASKSCAMCAMGALYAVVDGLGSPWSFDPDADRVAKWLGEEGLIEEDPTGNRCDLVYFNDQVAKTREDVTAVLRKGAELAKEQGR